MQRHETEPMIDTMSKFDRADRLQADSTPGIKGRFDHEVLDLVPLKFQGRKLRPGTLLNALVLWWLEQPETERREIAENAVARLESFVVDSRGEFTAEIVPAAEASPATPARDPHAMYPVAERDETAMEVRKDRERAKAPRKGGPKRKA